ncbi:MAG: hypothetical protein WD575_03970 [Nitriliruptoraceae bacterium]
MDGEPGGSGESGEPSVSGVDRADRVAERLAVPVLLAALASVPAVFLTLMQDPWSAVGSGLNTLSGGVLIAETVVLFALAEDRIGWLRRNRWLVALTLALIPAVVFALGPVQMLRLLRVVGALRIIRVGRILKAGRIVRQRAGLDHGWHRVIGATVSLLGAAFVALVLIDPTSTSRQFLDGAVTRLGWIGVVVAGVIVAVATWVVRTQRDRDDDAPAWSAGHARGDSTTR